MNNDTDAKKLISMIKDVKFAMLTTVTESGALHSRPMGTLKGTLEDFDGTLWFFSKKNSFKNHDIENDQHVNLSYSDPHKQHYISVSGTAFVSSDRKKMEELWTPLMKAWFPDGLADPDISLIGIRVENAEIWDSPPGKVVQLAGFVKAAVTGKPYDQNHHSQHIELGH